MLTFKQSELLLFLDYYLKTHYICPSFEEMKIALDLKSKSGIHRLITALEERRYIRRLPNRARALEVLRLPEGMSPETIRERQARFSHIFPAGKTSLSIPPETPSAFIAAAASVPLPLYGRIAAGLAIESVPDTTRTVDVPASIVGRGDHYVLEVAGDSMIEAGILDGDLVIIRHSETAHDGDIVVALLDDGDVTLKYLYRRNGKVALEPANKAYKTQIYDPDRIRIQGSLAALLRQYS